VIQVNHFAWIHSVSTEIHNLQECYLNKHLTVAMIKKYWYRSRKLFMLVMMIIPAGSSLHAQNEYDILGENWLQYTDAPNSLYHYISGQAFDMLAARSKEINMISSLSGWQERDRKQFVKPCSIL
jgi:hypothetical protein